MLTKEKFTGMFNTLGIYLKQRFNPLIFGGLNLFLMLFAKGNIVFSGKDFFIILILLSLILIFRLFDDLQNKEFDSKKNEQRIYTLPGADFHLQKFLLIFAAIFLSILFYFEWHFGLLISCFFAFNYFLYRCLIQKWKFRNLLPLLKYPFLCILLIMALQNQYFLNQNQLLFCLSVFPAFIIFESLNDKDFKLNKRVFHAIFISCYLCFLPGLLLSPFKYLSLILIALSYLVIVFPKSSGSGYFFLTLFLLTRLTYTYGI